MKLVRFPGGSYKSSADSFSPVKQECKPVLKENGYYYCDWNALNGDAEGKKKRCTRSFGLPKVKYAGRSKCCHSYARCLR